MDAPLTANPSQQTTQSAATAGTTSAAGATPFELEYITITRREYIELQCQARQFQSLHARAVKRMQAMQAEQARTVEALRAQQALLRAELEQARAQLRGLRQ